MKQGADGKTRSLYSFRHYYATRDLKRGISSHALSRQLGNSTAMVDKHYSKYSPLLNAELHSGRSMRGENKKTATASAQTVVCAAFAMLADGKLGEQELLAALGVERDGYVVTEKVAQLALAAKGNEQISSAMLLRILNG